jgi:hypothetical protein
MQQWEERTNPGRLGIIGTMQPHFYPVMAEGIHPESREHGDIIYETSGYSVI